MKFKQPISSLKRAAHDKAPCNACRTQTMHGMRSMRSSFSSTSRRCSPRVRNFTTICSLFYIFSKMTFSFAQTMPTLITIANGVPHSSFFRTQQGNRKSIPVFAHLIPGVSSIGRKERRKLFCPKCMGLEGDQEIDHHLNEEEPEDDIKWWLMNTNQDDTQNVRINEIQHSYDNDEEKSRQESSEEDRDKKRDHKLMYISFAVLLALFVKSDRFNLACSTHESLEYDRLPDKKTDEKSPLISNHSSKNQLDTCKWCKQMKPSEPMPITNFNQESLDEAYHTDMAHYDLLTWRMYNRIVSSRYDRAYLPVQNVFCASCGSSILFDDALVDHEKDSAMSCVTGDVEDQVFAFSLDL